MKISFYGLLLVLSIVKSMHAMEKVLSDEFVVDIETLERVSNQNIYFLDYFCATAGADVQPFYGMKIYVEKKYENNSIDDALEGLEDIFNTISSRLIVLSMCDEEKYKLCQRSIKFLHEKFYQYDNKDLIDSQNYEFLKFFFVYRSFIYGLHYRNIIHENTYKYGMHYLNKIYNCIIDHRYPQQESPFQLNVEDNSCVIS